MSDAKLILLVRFKSALPFEEVLKVADSRIEDFRALKGLKQKYYLKGQAEGEVCGLYIWESEEDFTAYRDSELRQTIAAAYQAEGAPTVEVFPVFRTLREG